MDKVTNVWCDSSNYELNRTLDLVDVCFKDHTKTRRIILELFASARTTCDRHDFVRDSDHNVARTIELK